MLMKETTGLIIVDIQGKLARLVHDSDTLIANCEKLIKAAQVLDLPIVYLEQNPDKLGTTVDELEVLLSEYSPIHKYAFNACDESSFLDALKSYNIDTWLVCGIEAHICLYQTATGLSERGYKVQVVSDCIASRKALNKQLALTRLQQNNIAITGLEMCLYEMVKDCRSIEFKDILTLVR